MNTYLYIQSLMGTLCFEKARHFSNWWIQCTGKNPVVFADKLGVTGTRIAWEVTTCSVKTSCVKICLIRCIELIRMAIFMPRVWQTKSPIEFIWFEWKCMAIRSNISPKDAVKPIKKIWNLLNNGYLKQTVRTRQVFANHLNAVEIDKQIINSNFNLKRKIFFYIIGNKYP